MTFKLGDIVRIKQDAYLDGDDNYLYRNEEYTIHQFGILSTTFQVKGKIRDLVNPQSTWWVVNPYIFELVDNQKGFSTL